MSNLTHPTCPEQFLYIFMIKYLSKKPESLKQKQIVIKTSIIVSFFFFSRALLYYKNQSLSIGDTRDRLNSIIGPWSQLCTGVHTYTNTHRNKIVIVDKIKHIFIVLAIPTISVFKHKKYDVHNIHRLAWGPYTCRASGQLSNVPVR